MNLDKTNNITTSVDKSAPFRPSISSPAFSDPVFFASPSKAPRRPTVARSRYQSDSHSHTKACRPAGRLWASARVACVCVCPMAVPNAVRDESLAHAQLRPSVMQSDHVPWPRMMTAVIHYDCSAPQDSP